MAATMRAHGPRCSASRAAAPRASAVLLAPLRAPLSAAPAAVHLTAPLRVEPFACAREQRRQLRRFVRAAPQDAVPEEPVVSEDENVAIEQDFDLLSNKVNDLTPVLVENLRGCSIFLIGMMGSGKSTAGRMLANSLKYAFFDTDDMIEKTHKDMSVSDIFKEYGEEYFRTAESTVLKQLASYKNLVVATGGGAVLNTMNWSYMRNGVVVWLAGEPALLAKRVAKDGPEKRPLLAGEGMAADNMVQKTTDKLSTILADRTKYYENADIVVDIASLAGEELGAPTAATMYRIMTAINNRIEETKRERAERMNFQIKYAEEAPNMKVIPSPAAQAQQQQEGAQ